MAALKKVTIANGNTDSPEVDREHYQFLAVEIPAGFDGTTLTFKGSAEKGGTKAVVNDSAGVALSLTVAASTIATMSNALTVALAPLRYLVLVADSQTGDADLVLICT